MKAIQPKDFFLPYHAKRNLLNVIRKTRRPTTALQAGCFLFALIFQSKLLYQQRNGNYFSKIEMFASGQYP